MQEESENNFKQKKRPNSGTLSICELIRTNIM